MDMPTIHVHHDDYDRVLTALNQSGLRGGYWLTDNRWMEPGHYAIGTSTSIQGGIHPVEIIERMLYAKP